uniref:SNF2 N-terminal domain-containing protein n=1 Tax=Glossina pallidipes TaxID=7398 RepID=A0A1A9ZYY0_GLOPL
MDEMYGALVRPCPDLVICDEGHRIKNSQAGISQALKEIHSHRRTVFTGYPLDTNLVEYWCTTVLSGPNYLRNKTQFCNMFERPVHNGFCVDSTDVL